MSRVLNLKPLQFFFLFLCDNSDRRKCGFAFFSPSKLSSYQIVQCIMVSFWENLYVPQELQILKIQQSINKLSLWLILQNKTTFSVSSSSVQSGFFLYMFKIIATMITIQVFFFLFSLLTFLAFKIVCSSLNNTFSPQPSLPSLVSFLPIFPHL